jgi:hypothetical protein
MQSNKLLQEARIAKDRGSALARAYLNGLFRDRGYEFCDVVCNPSSRTALNSLSGKAITQDNKQFFFKFHSEEGETSTLQVEMYAAALLVNAGWPVRVPVASSCSVGSQCVLYEWSDQPTLYDIFLEFDKQFYLHQPLSHCSRSVLRSVEESLLTIQKALFCSLEIGVDTSMSPLHQLFGHRAMSSHGVRCRLERFYAATLESTFCSDTFCFRGKRYQSLKDCLTLMQQFLDPQRFKMGPSVIAHGDEHFANQMYVDQRVVLFDPAFASRMPLVLAQIKAIVHNTLCHPFWFYETAPRNLFSLVETSERVALLRLYKNIIWSPVYEVLCETCLDCQQLHKTIRAAIFACALLTQDLGVLAQKNNIPHEELITYALMRAEDLSDFLLND